MKIISAGILFLLASAAWADTAPVLADTCIKPASPASNFGQSGLLEVSPQSSTLIRFDFSQLATGLDRGLVASATMRLYVNRLIAPGSIRIFDAGWLWNEGTVTGATPILLGSQAGSAVIATGQTYVSIDVTAYVQNALRGNPVNTDWGLVIQAVDGTSAFFDSKESVTSSHPATLDIVVTGSPGNTGPQGPAGVAGSMGAAGSAGIAGPAPGFTWVTANALVAGNTGKQLPAFCPAAQPTVLAGACDAPQVTFGNFNILGTYPLTTGTQGWVCRIHNSTSSIASATTHALCTR